MVTRVRKSAAERKEEIVDATLRLAGDIGPDRITTEALAKEIGISQPGIFRHFPTKSDIWEAVSQHISTILQAKASVVGNKNARPVEQLHDFVLGHLAFIVATPAIPAILFSRELHSENEKLRAFFASLLKKRHQKFARLIQAEIDSGFFKKSLNADDAAYLILVLIQGLAMRWSLNNRAFDLVEEGRRLLDLQLEGFKQPPEKG